MNRTRRACLAVLFASLFLVPSIAGQRALAAPRLGSIVFGRSFSVSHGRFIVHSVHSVFHLRDRIAWVAYFSEPVNATQITLFLMKKFSNGAFAGVWDHTYAVGDPNAGVLGNSVQAMAFEGVGATAPGAYIMRYARGTTTLAQGTFTLKP